MRVLILAALAALGAGWQGAAPAQTPASARTGPKPGIAVAAAGQGSPLTLDRLVSSSTVIAKDGATIRFALHGLVWFTTLDQLFSYIDAEAGRWSFPSDDARSRFADDLLNRGVESRVVSMDDGRPLDLLVTHTSNELAGAIDALPAASGDALFVGAHWQLARSAYRRAFLRVQARWKSSLNCWSGAPTIQARALSNWFLIDEGIELFGATYDSTEHFWQAVKYHPEVTAGELRALVGAMEGVDWDAWTASLARNQDVYFRHTYAIEFLRYNLSAERRAWFGSELAKAEPDLSSGVRSLQQRAPGMRTPPRFTALQEKTLWGDLADLLHLVYFFSELEGGRLAPTDVRLYTGRLRTAQFDAVYLAGYRSGRIGFISQDFRELMREIWKVKFLRMARFREVIASIRDVKLDHFLNDGDSPDIPIPVYVSYLNEIRELARDAARQPRTACVSGRGAPPAAGRQSFIGVSRSSPS